MVQQDLVLGIASWTDAPAGKMLEAFAQHVGLPVTVRQDGQVKKIAALPRIEPAYRPFWG